MHITIETRKMKKMVRSEKKVRRWDKESEKRRQGRKEMKKKGYSMKKGDIKKMEGSERKEK